MKTTKKYYGTATLAVSRNGDLILKRPPAIVRALRLRVGDTVTINRRKRGGWICRFYRLTRRGWRRLLLGHKSRSVRRPR